jgi:hypothetical protein
MKTYVKIYKFEYKINEKIVFAHLIIKVNSKTKLSIVVQYEQGK